MQSDRIVENLDQLLLEALNKRASDIHFEPYRESYRIRMRIDGVLQTMLTAPITLAKQIAARLKIMAKLDIAEQRLPQDGQLTIHNYAIRISTLPVTHGEKIVLRVMDNQKQQLLLTDLGFSDRDLLLYQQHLLNPQGLILVTGPTGSGKSVTLYSGIKSLNKSDRNICSVEDPIEITLEGVNQTQVNIKIGLTFASILRAFLRQDPDLIMVGEIRDSETAIIATQAAQTGHLVLSTLHTNSTIEAVTRLNQMGVANYHIAATLKLVIAQRLVRKLCPFCKKEAKDKMMFSQSSFNTEFADSKNQSIKKSIKVIEDKNSKEQYRHFIAVGCQNCIGGYSGRVGIYELLVITPEIQKQIINQQPIYAKTMTTLRSSGEQLVKTGITSVAELDRILGVSSVDGDVLGFNA